MKTLEEKIEELKTKHEVELLSEEFEDMIKNMFPSMKTSSYIKEWNGLKKTSNFELNTKEEVKEVLSTLKPTEIKTVIGFAGKENCTLETPYKMDLNNPCQTGTYSRFEMLVSYKSNDIDVRVKIPIELVSDFVMATSRRITSSEYHYFTGVSQRELNRMKVRAYTYTTNDYISWYGGDKTLKNIEKVNEIIKYLTK